MFHWKNFERQPKAHSDHGMYYTIQVHVVCNAAVKRSIGILSSFFSTLISASFLYCFHSTAVLTVELNVKLRLFTADKRDVFVVIRKLLT
jgi:hypothetical protein